MTIGHNSSEVEGEQLRSFVERIETLEAEIRDRNDDKKSVYDEAKSSGFDTKIIKKVVAIRRQDTAKRIEEETILGLYLEALGMDDATHVRAHGAGR